MKNTVGLNCDSHTVWLKINASAISTHDDQTFVVLNVK